MSFQPKEWNVVIVGYWNLAILSPAGIAKRLFQLDDTPVEVLVPLDGMAPIQVKHESISVVPSQKQLIVTTTTHNAATFNLAKGIAATALRNLPETPVQGVGVNFRFVTEPGETANELLNLFQHESDNRLSDADFEIVSRSMGRSVRWNDGVLNVSLSEAAGEPYQLLFNFELKSTDNAALTAWVERPAEDFLGVVHSLLRNYLLSEIETDAGVSNGE